MEGVWVQGEGEEGEEREEEGKRLCRILIIRCS